MLIVHPLGSRHLLIFFAEILHTGRAAIDMKHQRGFKFEGLGPSLLGGLRGGTEVKIKLFQNMVMLHIKLKLTTLAATW